MLSDETIRNEVIESGVIELLTLMLQGKDCLPKEYISRALRSLTSSEVSVISILEQTGIESLFAERGSFQPEATAPISIVCDCTAFVPDLNPFDWI